jgi:hypothetical protein
MKSSTSHIPTPNQILIQHSKDLALGTFPPRRAVRGSDPKIAKTSLPDRKTYYLQIQGMHTMDA